MLEFILKWIEKANILIHGNITWNSSAQLRDQIMSHQVMMIITIFLVVSSRHVGSKYCTLKYSCDLSEILAGVFGPCKNAIFNNAVSK